VKIFISWSGEPSRTVALALHRWLPDLIQEVEPWMSEADVDAGTRWNERIQRQLSETKFGVACVTPGNMHAPWLIFESGALAKTVEDSHVCPYLIGLDRSDLTGPLAQFQAKRATREDTLSLVQSINRTLGEKAIVQERIERGFERWWPDLEGVLSSLPPPAEAATPRPAEDMLEELLLLVRNIDLRTRRAGGIKSYVEDLLNNPEVIPGVVSDPDFYHYWLLTSLSKHERGTFYRSLIDAAIKGLRGEVENKPVDGSEDEGAS
jgi:hypothetical protein